MCLATLNNRVCYHELSMSSRTFSGLQVLYSSIACTCLRAQYMKSVNIVSELRSTHCVTSGKLPFQIFSVLLCKMNRLDKLTTKVLSSSNILLLYGSVLHFSWWPSSNTDNLFQFKISPFIYKIKHRYTKQIDSLMNYREWSIRVTIT